MHQFQASGTGGHLLCKAENLADAFMENKIGFPLHFGLAFIDYDKVFAVIAVRQGGSATDREGSSAYDKAVCMI